MKSGLVIWVPSFIKKETSVGGKQANFVVLPVMAVLVAIP